MTKWRNFEILCNMCSCLCTVLAVSVLYFKKKHWNRLRENSKIRHFVISSHLFYWHANHISLKKNKKIKLFFILIILKFLTDCEGYYEQGYYTQYVLISKGPISKTSQISGFFKQWLVKFSKLSNNLFCSRFLSNPLVNFFKLSKSKLLL